MSAWTRVMVVVVAAVGFAATAETVVGCGSLEKAAAKDPMKCERDPKCKDKKDRSADCVTQCVDNPECIDRCRSVSGQR